MSWKPELSSTVEELISAPEPTDLDSAGSVPLRPRAQTNWRAAISGVQYDGKQVVRLKARPNVSIVVERLVEDVKGRKP